MKTIENFELITKPTAGFKLTIWMKDGGVRYIDPVPPGLDVLALIERTDDPEGYAAARAADKAKWESAC